MEELFQDAITAGIIAAILALIYRRNLDKTHPYKENPSNGPTAEMVDDYLYSKKKWKAASKIFMVAFVVLFILLLTL